MTSGERLAITALSDGEDRCRLEDFVWPGDRPAIALHSDDDGQRWLERSWVREEGRGRRRWVERYLLSPEGTRALERICFQMDEACFSEIARTDREGGANLHFAPITMPAELVRGEVCRPLAGRPGEVTLLFAGPAELRLGGRGFRGRAAMLRASQGGDARDQWLLAGVGEVGIGPPDGPLERWMTAWSAPDEAELFGGVPLELRRAPLPPLPTGGEASGPTPGGSFFRASPRCARIPPKAGR
jgi:hypothetical protein